MQQIKLQLEDWQQAALAEMARASGLGITEMAQNLLNAQLLERLNMSASIERAFLLLSPSPCADTIEQRLKILFEA
jgi:acyl CoA:acetate/3-ketoacid CoA transferase alpha subunit